MGTQGQGDSDKTDISPWPNAQNFSGYDAWWKHVMSVSEGQRLDYLLGAALLNMHLQRRLIEERDDTLLKAFGLSETSCEWLRSIHATSLAELSEKIANSEEYQILSKKKNVPDSSSIQQDHFAAHMPGFITLDYETE